MAFLIEMQIENKFHNRMIDNMPNFMELSELVIIGFRSPSGTFFIVSSIGMIPVASGRIKEISPLARCAYTCMLVGFYVLCGVIALLLLPFSFHRCRSGCDNLSCSYSCVYQFFMANLKNNMV